MEIRFRSYCQYGAPYWGGKRDVISLYFNLCLRGVR